MIRFVLFSLFLALPAGAQTVSTGAELRVALQQASAGAVITLTAGNYGALQWQGGRGVTVQGAGTFTGLVLTDVRDITLNGVRFADAPSRDSADHARPFVVTDSQGVTFQNVQFQGGRTGYGLSITDSRDVTLQGGLIQGFQRGLVVQDSGNIVVLDTEFMGQRSDGMNFAAVEGVTIARNYIHDFDRDPNSGDHADMIQFWTRGTERPSTDIRITDNLLNVGDGLWTQSIFMRNEAFEAGQAEMAYRDVTISNNMIINAHLHGITVGEADGLRISRNTLVQNPHAAGLRDNPVVWIPQITVAAGARDVQVSGNIAGGITAPSAQAAGNVIVLPQNASAVFGAQIIRQPSDPWGYLQHGLDVGAMATPAWR
jgi:nitrous oxidase accessory protein NosD